MPLFTTDTFFKSGIASKSKSCQVGSDIWVFECARDHFIEIIKIDIDARAHWKWSYQQRNYNRHKDFHICSSNGKIYLWISVEVGAQLREFNLVDFEWKTLTTTTILPANFFVLRNKMYIKKDRTLMVMCMDTFEITKTVNLVVELIDEVIFLEMNGLVYMVTKERIGTISIHYYDADNGVFQRIMYMDEQRRVDFQERFGEKDIFAWSSNNKIYVTLVSRDRILINCFDVVAKQCDTVMDSHYGGDEVMDMFAREDMIYVLSRRCLDVIIQKIEMHPSLETIALISMADMTLDDPTACHNACRNLIPYELRTRFNRIFSRRTHLTSLGMMQVLVHEMRRLATNRDNEVGKLMELLLQMDIEQQQLYRAMIGIVKTQELMKVMGNVMDKFVALQYDFIKVLGEQQQAEQCQTKAPSERHIKLFEGLSHDFLKSIEQPEKTMVYTWPMATRHYRTIKNIAEIEKKTKQQKEKFISEQEKLGGILNECWKKGEMEECVDK